MTDAPCHQPAHPDHVLKARRDKREQAEAAGLDEQSIDRVVEAFYARIRADAVLGPIFASRIDDWPTHLARMKQFWRSILLGTGEFSGNPMQRHQQICGLTAEHFSRWLDLFYATLRDQCPQPEGLAMFAARARMIAKSLLIGIELQRDGLRLSTPSRSLPHA